MDERVKGLADRVASTAAGVARDGLELAKDRIEAADGSASVRLKSMLSSDAPMTPEAFLVLLVDVANEDEERTLTDKHLKRAGKRRARLAGLAGLPLGRAGLSLASLYCETELFCDVAIHHGLDLSDEQIAAHLLVLWNAAPDLEWATAAIIGTGPSVACRLTGNAVDHVLPKPVGEMTAMDALAALWRLRGLVDEDNLPGTTRLWDVMLPAGRVKDVKRAAEAQLCVTPAPSPKRWYRLGD